MSFPQGYTGPNKWVEEIEKDLHRNFPTHEMFGGSFERIGRRELFDVLRAYSLHNTKDGFCQAQAPVAALLLMNMPEEEAFWTLVSICERYIPGEHRRFLSLSNGHLHHHHGMIFQVITAPA